ncbi:hypothetical protein BH09BAC6_BH09BAC6_28850 [soil metagenome]
MFFSGKKTGPDACLWIYPPGQINGGRWFLCDVNKIMLNKKWREIKRRSCWLFFALIAFGIHPLKIIDLLKKFWRASHTLSCLCHGIGAV